MTETADEATLHPDYKTPPRASRLRLASDEELPEALRDMVAASGEQADRGIALRPASTLKLFDFLGEVMDPTWAFLSPTERDFIAAIVAAENRCTIAFVYHVRKLGDHLDDHQRALALAINPRTAAMSIRERAIATFVVKATRESWDITDDDVDELRAAGLDDDAIFQVAQVTAAFNLTTILENAIGLYPTVTQWK